MEFPMLVCEVYIRRHFFTCLSDFADLSDFVDFVLSKFADIAGCLEEYINRRDSPILYLIESSRHSTAARLQLQKVLFIKLFAICMCSF